MSLEKFVPRDELETMQHYNLAKETKPGKHVMTRFGLALACSERWNIEERKWWMPLMYGFRNWRSVTKTLDEWKKYLGGV